MRRKAMFWYFYCLQIPSRVGLKKFYFFEKAVQLFLPVRFIVGFSNGVLVSHIYGFKLGALVGCAVYMTKYYCTLNSQHQTFSSKKIPNDLYIKIHVLFYFWRKRFIYEVIKIYYLSVHIKLSCNI